MEDFAYENLENGWFVYDFHEKSRNSTPTNPFDAESNFLLGGGSGDTWNLPKWCVFCNFQKNLEIRRRLIRSMRNRISYSVAVAVTPETFQSEVIFKIFKKVTEFGAD